MALSPKRRWETVTFVMKKKEKHFFLLTGVRVRELTDEDLAPKKLSPEELADLEAQESDSDVRDINNP